MCCVTQKNNLLTYSEIWILQLSYFYISLYPLLTNSQSTPKMTVQYIRQHECDFCVKFRQSALFLTQCCRKQRERKKWLTVRWRQRCSCLAKERLWRDACRSPFAHCDCKREKKQQLWELETCETAVHTLILDKEPFHDWNDWTSHGIHVLPRC